MWHFKVLNLQIILDTTCIFTIGSQAFSRARFGIGTGPIHMDDVGCVGNENRLVDCSHTMKHNCRHSEDASVRCMPISYREPLVNAWAAG